MSVVAVQPDQRALVTNRRGPTKVHYVAGGLDVPVIEPPIATTPVVAVDAA